MLSDMIKKIKAYTLLELSIVLVILSTLVIGGWNLSAAQAYNKRMKKTQENMKAIEDALVVFLAENGRLPCPASPSQLNLNNTFGMEQITPGASGAPQACNTTSSNINIYSGNPDPDTIYLGAPPVSSLGLPDSIMYDGWGNRLGYAVQQSFSNNTQTNTSCTTPATVNHSNTSYFCYNGQASNSRTGYNGLRVISANNTSSVVAQDPVYILISYGQNGYGAFTMNSDVDLDNGGTDGPNYNQNSMPPTSNTLEYYNLSCDPSTYSCNSSSVNSTFVQGEQTSTFDDIIKFKTRNQLLLECNKYLGNACKNNYGILVG